MKVTGVPFDQGKHKRSALKPTAVVVHRTYGRWSGDYNIGKNGRREGKTIAPIGFHFLVGKDEGQWVQFYDTEVVCNHAAGANSWAVGIEISGRNEDPLTDWQVRALRWILTAVCDHHRIQKRYTSTGSRRRLHHVMPHSLVPGSTHTDKLSDADWDRVFPPAPPAPPALTRIPFGKGARGRHVDIFHWQLAVVTGRGLDITKDNKTHGANAARVVADVARLLGRNWGDGYNVTAEVWQVVDYLYTYNGHTPIAA